MNKPRALPIMVALGCACVGSLFATRTTGQTDTAEAHVVEISGFKFIPESLVVKPGDSVTWINRDIAPHTATATDNTFDTDELQTNESIMIKIADAQSGEYFCRYHLGMKGGLIVNNSK